MRKYLTLFTLLFILFALNGVRNVFSQVSPTPEVTTEVTPAETPTTSTTPTSASFDQAYQEYLDEIEKYKGAHQDYLFRKAQYQRFGTLKSRQDAQIATAAMLQTRDDVVVSYLSLVKTLLTESKGITDEKLQGLVIRADEEIGWWKDHKAAIPSAGTLKDLENDSAEARSRWAGVDPLVYEILAEIANGRVSDYMVRTNEFFARVKDMIVQIRSKEGEGQTFSSEKFDVLDRWVFETDNRIVRAKERKAEGEEASTLLKRRRTNALPAYNNVIVILGETQLYLKEANTFMKEIIREIKTAE